MTRGYRDSRKSFNPVKGTVYENQGGGVFRCLKAQGYSNGHAATMQNVASGWTFQAHGIGIYEDGRIDWDYSTGGTFQRIGG